MNRARKTLLLRTEDRWGLRKQVIKEEAKLSDKQQTLLKISSEVQSRYCSC